MRIFITGGSGLVGSNCIQYFSDKGHEVIGSYFNYKTSNTVFYNSLNIHDRNNNYDINAFQPEVIVHCGAMTNVDLCEAERDTSFNNTVISARNMLEVAKENNAAMVYISTDYVFDGANGPYTEQQHPSPIQVYGQHKLDAEQLMLSYDNHLIIRVTGVYGDEERRKNFVVRLMDQMKENNEKVISLPYDQYSTPINARDIARAILLLLTNNKTGTYHLAGTDYLSRYQLGKRINLYFEHAKIKIHPSDTASLKQQAKRPLNCGLKAAKFLSEFPDFTFSNVDDFITNKTYV